MWPATLLGMRVLLCPDKFAGTLPAQEVAAAVATGWQEVASGDDLVIRPLADGGPGFVAVLAGALGGRRLPVSTVDPLGRPAAGEILLTADGSTAYLESAQACGLHLLSAAERDPKATTSYGLGLLVTAAVESGARTVVIGLGGSGTNDAGAGMLAALGTTALDQAGQALPYGGAALAAVAALDGTPRLRGVRLVAATDVDNPLLGLHGASNVYGPQKGATREDVLLLDAALERFADVLVRDLPGCPPQLGTLPGGGAAGGLGAAVLALGGHCESGIGLVTHAIGLDAALDECDLVITGEGSFDHQSLRGKVVAGVAGAARDRGVPCVVVAGRVSTGRREAASAGVTDAYSLVEHFGGEERGGLETAMSRPADGLRELGARLARQWSR
ncbi:glycerate kinase family protein [Micromonospora yangpuensis]|uniref:Glycerate kinase n=1 Tax=Micromonospora yangpuensis TaxID=683228 RepID=A0A1C6V0T4_9ACTN|nr:glycerate kinase [Micromonospora yangpuensis]GGL97171.1 glycerate kinase [Micromonospora yangpuensis]SCL59912.1 glycerate kinase [Micromonospora yangpuensis]